MTRHKCQGSDTPACEVKVDGNDEADEENERSEAAPPSGWRLIAHRRCLPATL